MMRSPSTLTKKLTLVALDLGLLAFAFFFTFKAGERGFMPFDQSIVFDGGYRILSGQIPYKDFVIPIGPVVFLLQAAAFKLLGINYFSYIFGAALFNVLATLCSVAIVRLLFASHRFLSYIAGLLTAIWFYPPFGTLYYDQTAFFFSLAATTVLLSAVLIEKRSRVIDPLLLFVSGGFAFVSFMSKQNAGLFVFPLYFLLLGAAGWPERRQILTTSLFFLAGFIAGAAAFLGWLLLESRLDIFLRSFFEVPASLGLYRARRDLSHLLRTLFYGRGPTSTRLALSASFIVGLVAFFKFIRNHQKTAYSSKPWLLSCILCAYPVFYQRLFYFTTKNQPENCLPFIGIILGCGVGLLLQLTDSGASAGDTFAGRAARSHVYARAVVIIVALLTIFGVAAKGISVSLNRDAHDLIVRSEFLEHFEEEKLKSLRWAEPTGIRGVRVTKKHIIELLGWLKEKNEPFFVYRDFTILYALADAPSPQPLLWFHKGLTYPMSDNVRLDKWIVKDLEKNGVRIVILEEKTLIGTENSLDDFPIVRRYIGENFHKTGQIGIFGIHEMKASETEQ